MSPPAAFEIGSGSLFGTHGIRRPSGDGAAQLARNRIIGILSRRPSERFRGTARVRGPPEKDRNTSENPHKTHAGLAVEQRSQRRCCERGLAEAREPNGELLAERGIFAEHQRMPCELGRRVEFRPL